MLRESRTPKVQDWLVGYVVKKSPHAEELRTAWFDDPDPAVAGAGWALTSDRVVRAPEGHTYVWTENPSGINGYLLVSRGEKTPWRLKIRSASFANVAALGAMLPGAALGDVVTILASTFYVVGDIDR